jgi:hypothetical protein
MRIARKTPVVVLGLVLSIVFIGCADGAPSADAEVSLRSSPPASSKISSQRTAADTALAQAANLKLSDFPSGWTSSPNTPDTSGNAIEKQLADCLHTSIQIFEENAKNPSRVESPNFSDPLGDEASSSITYEKSEAQVAQQMTIFNKSTLPTCMERAIGAVMKQAILKSGGATGGAASGVLVGQPVVSRLSFPALAQRSIAYETTVPITVRSLTVNSYIDFIALQRGNAGIFMDFLGVGTPFGSAQERHLTGVVLSRLSNS